MTIISVKLLTSNRNNPTVVVESNKHSFKLREKKFWLRNDVISNALPTRSSFSQKRIKTISIYTVVVVYYG